MRDTVLKTKDDVEVTRVRSNCQDGRSFSSISGICGGQERASYRYRLCEGWHLAYRFAEVLDISLASHLFFTFTSSRHLPAFAYHSLPCFLFRSSCLVNTSVNPSHKRSHASFEIRFIRCAHPSIMSFPDVNARSIVELWMQLRDDFARSQEESVLSDPDEILSDPDRTMTDPDMPLSACTMTSPVNAPCVVPDSGFGSPNDPSVHSVEDVSVANQDGLSVDPESDFFVMGQYFQERYTHIFNSFTFQMDSAAISSQTNAKSQKDHETEKEDKSGGSFTNDIIKMMFVSGETAEPSPETTTLIEEITRQQVIEILTRSTALATRRGVRSISTDDLIFLIRHDKAKVSRLRTFLSWKDVRKNVKDSDDKGGGDAADFAAADDAAGVVAGPADVAPKPKNKRAKVGLAWDVNSFYSIQVPEREDEEDEEEEEQNYATLQRLAAADERTRHMTREEYVFWSECRQASFTYRKSKRFREWAGFGIVTESKPNDDIVDILGFLTFEIVQTLTEEALKVKEREDNEKHRRGGAEAGENMKKRKRETGLFDPPEEGRTPIEPRHVREAYRKLQATPQKAKAMLLHNGRVPYRFPLALI